MYVNGMGIAASYVLVFLQNLTIRRVPSPNNYDTTIIILTPYPVFYCRRYAVIVCLWV